MLARLRAILNIRPLTTLIASMIAFLFMSASILAQTAPSSEPVQSQPQPPAVTQQIQQAPPSAVTPPFTPDPKPEQSNPPVQTELNPSLPDAKSTSLATQKQALPHDLSPWGMFMAADIVVKGVMLGLVFASLLTWAVWFTKTIGLFIAMRKLRRSAKAIKESETLMEATLNMRRSGGFASHLLDAAVKELNLSGGLKDANGIKERVASHLDTFVAAAGRQMNRGTGVLATIGSTSPFVGLFGTVWGIMNSFINISKTQTTNLAVVAPGIAEALLATAIGLVAAIPAVIFYNHFARSIATYKASLSDVASDILRIVSRDLDRSQQVAK